LTIVGGDFLFTSLADIICSHHLLPFKSKLNVKGASNGKKNFKEIANTPRIKAKMWEAL
jgi:hypothetical protein